jgi:hypothetical protein
MKKRLTLSTIFVFAFIFIFQARLVAQMADSSATRGFWMYGSTLSNENIQTVVNDLSDHYVKDIYLLVKGTKGTLTPAENLTDFITKAHAKGMKVNLWYCVFQDEVYLAQNPKAHVYHCPNPSVNVRPYIMTTAAVNPLYPGYKEYVLTRIKYLLTNFDCDGIHLDYIRYSHFVYSWDPYTLLKAASLSCDTTALLGLFNTAANYTTNATNSGWITLYANRSDQNVVKWVNMRKNIIYDYIKSIRDTMQSLKPGLELSAAFMPEGATDPDLADAHYAQNYTLHSTVLDMISPMSYFKSYGHSTSWPGDVAKAAIARVSTNCKIAAGLQDFKGDDGLDVTSTELNNQIKSAIASGAHGVVIFRYETVPTDSWNVIKTQFAPINTAVTEINSLDFNLSQNCPNPFSSTTEISFIISKPCFVSLNIYDALGRPVSSLINKNMDAGNYKVEFDAKSLSGGVYFCKLNMGSINLVKKMILRKL